MLGSLLIFALEGRDIDLLMVIVTNIFGTQEKKRVNQNKHIHCQRDVNQVESNVKNLW